MPILGSRVVLILKLACVIKPSGEAHPANPESPYYCALQPNNYGAAGALITNPCSGSVSVSNSGCLEVSEI